MTSFQASVFKVIQRQRLFGVTLASHFSFTVHLPVTQRNPDLIFEASPSSPLAGGWELNSAVYTSPRHLPDGTSVCRLFRTPDYEVLSFPRTDFYLGADRIMCRLPEPGFHHLVESYLLGPVFAYWLERRSLPVLHASAVAFQGRAFAFLAAHGVGKSGLAAALLSRGAALLCDDLVPVESCGGVLSAQPGFPQMRMWPDEATCFLRRYEHLPRVAPDVDKRWVPAGPGGLGVFQHSPLPLGGIYFLERRPEGDAPIEIREISPRNALIEVLRHSFLPLLVAAAGLQPSRFDFFSRLVRDVPVRRLSYPSGFERLPEVADAVLRDLEC